MTPRRCFRVGALLAVIGVGLAACGTAPPAPTPAPEAEPQAPSIEVAHMPSPVHTEFERAQRSRALALEEQGRWFEAALAWEVLSVLEPATSEYTERLAAVRLRMQASAAEKVQRAAAARRRGDADAATQLYLSVLALQPDNETAAQALRALESERNKRQHLGKPSRTTLARRSSTDRAGPRAAAPATPSQTGDRNELEHAAMLVNQGELDDAIALLEKRHAQQRRDAATRALLADAYYKKGEALAISDAAAAVAALKKSLQLDAGHQRAAARLKLLSPPRATAATPTAPATRPAGQQAAL